MRRLTMREPSEAAQNADMGVFRLLGDNSSVPIFPRGPADFIASFNVILLRCVAILAPK